MTPGDNGASTPEDDDPFGYLYADGQANGAQPPTGGYGYPGSVNRVRAVGQRQYGQQQAQGQPGTQTAAYGQVPQQQAPYGQAYGQPNAHYAAPETMPGGGAPTRQTPGAGQDGPGRRGPNTKGLLIGAIAVVAAVVIGISIAMINGGSGDSNGHDKAGPGPTSVQSTSPSQSASSGATPAGLPKIDAKALRIEGGATLASDVKGAKADGGIYVAGFNQVGAKVTWTINNLETEGTYRLYVRYGIPGVDANATLMVDGKANSQRLNMKNFAGSPQGDWEKGWQTTWANVQLTKGTNTIQLVCNPGDQCNANIDQLYLQNG